MTGIMSNPGQKRSDFAERLSAHQGVVFGYIYSLVRNLDDADDLFQQTCLVLWDKYDLYDPARSFGAWACGIARFEVSNFLRTRSRKQLYFSDQLNLILAESYAELEPEQLQDRREALAECMKSLRRGDLELLEACYERAARIPEIAREWGRSTQSIHNSLRRIRRGLFECVRRSLAQGGIA
jgi:RNA polymerase sigma-70 factor (ECF subfamily)